MRPNAIIARVPAADDAPFESVDADSRSTDAAYLETLAALAGGSKAPPRGQKKRAAPRTPARPGYADVAAATLAPANVAKVVHDGVVCLDFLPCAAAVAAQCVLAVGSKRGNIGLWMCDPTSPDRDELRAAGDGGVFTSAPHRSYVSGICWLPGRAAAAPQLLSCSYDGSLLLLDVATATSMLVHAHPEREFSAMALAPDGNCAYLADPDGDLCIVDVRAKALAAEAVGLHARKVNSLDFRRVPSATALASSSTDASVCIWDVRKLARGGGHDATPTASVAHSKSCHAAFFAPDGSARMMSTSYDDSVRVWEERGGEWSLAASVAHNNQTGRWISPFRAVWTPDAAAGVIGDLKRAVLAFELPAGKQKHALQSEAMTAIPSRVACHAELPVVAAGTSSGRVHLWTRVLNK